MQDHNIFVNNTMEFLLFIIISYAFCTEKDELDFIQGQNKNEIQKVFSLGARNRG